MMGSIAANLRMQDLEERVRWLENQLDAIMRGDAPTSMTPRGTTLPQK